MRVSDYYFAGLKKGLIKIFQGVELPDGVAAFWKQEEMLVEYKLLPIATISQSLTGDIRVEIRIPDFDKIKNKKRTQEYLEGMSKITELGDSGNSI